WARKSRFPETQTVISRDAVRMSLLRNQTQHLVLTRPFDGEVAESGHAHSAGEPPVDRRLSEVWCGAADRHRATGVPGSRADLWRGAFTADSVIICGVLQRGAPALGVGQDASLRRPVQRSGVIVAIPVLSGLHHHYVRI